MARLYYTCPIQALYMMKEFGIEIEYFDKYGDKYNDTYSSNTYYQLEGYPDKIYVAKDSEHIFEPKSHDVVFWQEQQFSKIHPELHKDVIAHLGGNIVMRDDKHFFMPEYE